MLQIKMWIIILFFKAQGLRIFDRLIFATAKCETCDLFPILTSASGCSHDGGDSRVVCQLLPAGSISISDFWDKESKSNRWRRDSGSGSVMLPPSTATPPQTCKRCSTRTSYSHSDTPYTGFLFCELISNCYFGSFPFLIKCCNFRQR